MNHIETTPQGIAFEWWLDSSKGANFALLPRKGINTKEEISDSKRWLKSQRDVVKIYVEWETNEG